MRRPRSTYAVIAVLTFAALLTVFDSPTASRAAGPHDGDVSDAAPYYFMLSSTRSNKCLTVADASTTDGTFIVQETCDETAYHQHWSFFLVDDGSYLMVARHSGKCLTVADAGTANGTPAVQEPCSRENPAQQWSYPYVSGSSYLAVARHSGKCLTVAGGGTAEGAGVIQRTCLGSTNQQWRLGYY
ncbi:RICIN domain-containing protein [Actinoplanes sp. NPDC049548]|uniref:RICIN domain-containing protein n=1 Tax=Actinoplanes sp. NPDC049548 TaxID=3155152 RepID=UPI00344720A7